MKKSIEHIMILSLIFLFTLLFLSGSVLAQEKKVVKVGFPELTGFHSTDANGKHSGYNYEFLQEVAKYTGWKYEFITGDGTDASLLDMMDKLQKGEIDIIGGMILTDELAKTYDFPEYNSGNRYTTLSVLKKNQSINESNYATFNNMTVGIRENAKGSEKALDDFVATNGIKINKKKYPSDDDLRNALVNGEVDALLGADVTLFDNERIVARFNGKPYYFAVTKGNAEVVSGINTATAIILDQNPNYMTNLYMKYFDKSDRAVTIHSYIISNPTQSVIGALMMGLVLSVVLALAFYIHYQRKQQMLLDLERYRIISEISQELIFEYDYKTDQLVVSEENLAYFTKKGETEHFMQTLESLKAKGDKSAAEFIKLFGRRPPEHEKFELEFEGNLLTGESEWMRGVSVIIYDRHKQPLKAVGKIYSIENEKKERDILINQATRDPLTGLYNRITFEKKSKGIFRKLWHARRRDDGP